MKRKNNKIDTHDLNMKIIKEKMKNSLYIPSDLDKELIKKSHKRK